MGRGLSLLQQRILDLADQADSGTVYAFEVLVDVYGFPLARRGRVGGIHFDRRQIGRRYFSGTVAVSRAFNRIACRGLADRIIGGIRVHQDGENRHN